MTRLEAFYSLKHHPMYGPIYRKLTDGALHFCMHFLNEHQLCGTSDFGAAVNRMFLDLENKPKNRAIIQDLLTAANAIARRPAGRPKKEEGQMVRLDVRVPATLRQDLEAESAALGEDLGPYVRNILIDRKKGEKK
jgi:hypothetical protein